MKDTPIIDWMLENMYASFVLFGPLRGSCVPGPDGGEEVAPEAHSYTLKAEAFYLGREEFYNFTGEEAWFWGTARLPREKGEPHTFQGIPVYAVMDRNHKHVSYGTRPIA